MQEGDDKEQNQKKKRDTTGSNRRCGGLASTLKGVEFLNKMDR